jgi:F-type H+-transporting ATPase subunit delta
MAMKEKRYADALISISSAQDAMEGFQQELDALTRTYNDESLFREYLLDPAVDRSVKQETVSKVFSGRVRNELVNLLLLLVEKGSISSLPGIAKEFSRMADEKRNILNIEITAYEPLDKSQLEQLTEKLRKQFGASAVKSTVNIDKTLLGGTRVRIGDKLIDGSVAGSLKSLRNMLAR